MVFDELNKLGNINLFRSIKLMVQWFIAHKTSAKHDANHFSDNLYATEFTN